MYCSNKESNGRSPSKMDHVTTESRRNEKDELNTLKLNETLSCPVSLAVAGDEVIFVGDGHTHSVYQVALDNNGAFIRGQVLSTIGVAGSLPYGICLEELSNCGRCQQQRWSVENELGNSPPGTTIS